MPRFTIRPMAWRQINDELDYLEEQAGLITAERMLDRLLSTFALLSDTPKIGLRCGFRRPSTRPLRRWPVKDFENWLIFYRVTRYGVEIVHVLHGARDLQSLLDD